MTKIPGVNWHTYKLGMHSQKATEQDPVIACVIPQIFAQVGK